MMKPTFKRMVHNQVLTPIRPAVYKMFRGCRNKKAYESPALAQAAVDSIIRTGNDTKPDRPLRPYKCDICFAWHCGHDGLTRKGV